MPDVEWMGIGLRLAAIALLLAICLEMLWAQIRNKEPW